MTFDGTITLGTVLQIFSMLILAVALFNALSARLTVVEASFKEHATRLDRHESLILDLIKNIHGMLDGRERARR